MVCPLDLKKSKKDWRICADVIRQQNIYCGGKFKGLLANTKFCRQRKQNGEGSAALSELMQSDYLRVAKFFSESDAFSDGPVSGTELRESHFFESSETFTAS
jgi:hypothetical protein